MAVSRRVPEIADAEWRVMKLLWGRSPQSAAELTEALAPETSWKPATVKTLLSRLVSKKAIAYDKDGKQFLYRPVVGEGDCVRAESRSFLDRVFGGALTPMVAHMVEGGRVSPDELRRLRELIDSAERRQQGQAETTNGQGPAPGQRPGPGETP